MKIFCWNRELSAYSGDKAAGIPQPLVGGGSLELQPFISRPPIGYGGRREIEGDRERDRECTEERESV